ncbi:unnamed protein product [Urochloa humidicola]
MKYLHLSGGNEIIQLPFSFRNLEKLVHLDFSNCGFLIGITASLWRLSRLERLNLSHCATDEDLTRPLRGLTRLQHLNLSHFFCSGNLCRGLQPALVNLTKLTYLDIQSCLRSREDDKANNEILLECISRLPNLEYLNLAWNNNLYSIPETIGKFSKLRTLDLSYCTNLQTLPARISEIHSLKFLHVIGCFKLDTSTLPQYKNSAILLPHFVVHAGDSKSGSNLSQLEYENPTELEIIKLENVKSAEEARRIKFVEKQRIQNLELVWTRDARRYVDDIDVLKQLVPPDTVEKFKLQGYNSVTYPLWMVDISTYLPHLVEITMCYLPNSDSLPPLGQLQNLVVLRIGPMGSIKKIDRGFYGGTGAFPRLESFYLEGMECLEEWNTAYSSSEYGLKF